MVFSESQLPVSMSLCDVTLSLFPARGGIQFLHPIKFVDCFDQQNVGEVMAWKLGS